MFVMISCTALNVFAASPPGRLSEIPESSIARIEANLLSALKSENPGLQTSAAIILRQVKCLVPDYKFNNLIIPLMGIVKDESSENTLRITAALALHDLKSGRGDFAIKRTAQFTDCEKIKQICTALAWQRERNETP